MSAPHGPGASEAAPASSDTVIPVRLATVIGFCLYVGGYLALIGWFKTVDVYHAHFATTGILIAAYNLLRVVFIFYLFWMVYSAGAFLLRRVGGDTWCGLDTGEQLALGFFAGTGLWHVTLLGLGFLNLYTVPVALVLSVPMVALSYPDLRTVMRQIRSALAGANVAFVWRVGLVTLFAVTLLVVKGLYPGGGHDYFQHYFYFYQTVIERGGIWPNEIWDHYFVSKGAGLYFLAMLLTDPLAPQLVTACFMAVCGLVVFLLCRSAARGGDWPLVGVVLFLAAFVYTPIWGQFEKLHELNTSFLVAVLWIVTAVLERGIARANVLWAVAGVSTIIATVVVNTTSAIFLGAVFVILMAWYLLRRDNSRVIIAFGFAVASGLPLVTLLTINYVTTGLLNDQGLPYLWRFVDVEQVHRLAILPMAILLDWGSAGMTAEALSPAETVKFLKYAARLDLLFPLLLGAAAIGAAAFLVRRRAKQWTAPIGGHRASVLFAMVLAFLAVALLGGRSQPLSVFRHTSFMVPILIVASVSLWTLPLPDMPRLLRVIVTDRRTPLVVLALTLVSICMAASERARLFDTVLPRAWAFAAGASSIDMGYTLQQGWPNKPWGAIHPGARAARALVGPRTPIWSMHATIYCMLPDCRIEEADQFTLGTDWDVLMFGTPEQGRRVLQAAGINYFLFSRDLDMHDYLPLSPLLSPDNIARYLGIRWTDGTTALLTWSGPETVPLDAAWIEDYRRAVAQSGFMRNFPYADMQSIYAKLRTTAHPWRTIELPWRTRAP